MSVSTTPFTTATAPGALPLLGHARQLAYRPMEFMRSLHTYGDLVEIRIGRTPYYVPCHPELLHHVSTNDRVYDKGGPIYDHVRQFVSGVGTCPHAEHRTQRRLIQPAFRPDRLAHYAGTMQEEIAGLTGAWHEGQVLDPFPAFHALSHRITARTVVAARADRAAAHAISRSSVVLFDELSRQILTPSFLRRLPTPGNRRYRHAVRTLRQAGQHIIADYRRAPAQDADLLELLLRAQADAGGSGGAATEDIHAEMVGMLLGGTNSAPILTWAMVCLDQYPRVRERLHAEVDTVLAGRPAHYDDLPALPYTHRFLNETMRLHPAGWMTTRTVTCPAELAGRHLPAGTALIVSPPAVQHRPDVFPAPDRFDPDRWDRQHAPAPPRGSFLPFGAGPRQCIGDTFAMVEMVLTVATIAARWELTVVPGSDISHPPFQLAHLPRRIGLRITARPRP
ncbi:cytochrome P450 [Streptomyces longispororuber]|uniref:Cytochrome P450 n=1 Tax=Streptomyces longispororuber TaxID=68230 RepID=A0A919DU53_9ACTN|nr:cytochrome P450 [Streptomyces longispororuber]GHE79096.1 cytochrome P450 [Streptomyces longispororuber]